MDQNVDFAALGEGSVLKTAEGGAVLLGRCLGGGTFGKVYEATQNGVSLAVKVVNLQDEDHVKKIKREIEALGVFTKSGYTSDMYGHMDLANGTIFFLELLGPSLEDFLIKYKTTNSGFDAKALHRLAHQLLQGLDFIHKKGFIHGDIKPLNICVTREDPLQVKIVDMGESWRTDQLTTDQQPGTLQYNAPEALVGLPMDEKLDIWSLGCTLLELLRLEVIFKVDHVTGLFSLMMMWDLLPDNAKDGVSYDELLEKYKRIPPGQQPVKHFLMTLRTHFYEYSKRHWAVEGAAFAQFSKQPIFMYNMKNPNNFIEVKTGKKVTKDEMLAVMEGEGKEEAQTENLTTHVENGHVENKLNKGDNKKGKREKKGKEEELNAVVKKRKFTPYLI